MCEIILLQKMLKETAVKDVTVSTVDASQGCESKTVIVSFVRSHGNTAGFLRNEQRLNVAMTRARHALICVGNAQYLASLPYGFDAPVRSLSIDAFNRGLVFPHE